MRQLPLGLGTDLRGVEARVTTSPTRAANKRGEIWKPTVTGEVTRRMVGLWPRRLGHWAVDPTWR
jgi:hypothetical protein